MFQSDTEADLPCTLAAVRPHARVMNKAARVLSDAQCLAWEAGRDLEAELLESVRQYLRGQAKVVVSPVVAVRKNAGLSQVRFAKLLGVTVYTLRGWERGRNQPCGAYHACHPARGEARAAHRCSPLRHFFELTRSSPCAP